MAALKKREKMLVVFAGSALLIFLLNQFVCGDSKSDNGSDKTPVVAEKKQGNSDVKIKSQKKTEAHRPQKSRKQIQFVSWGRDPFSEAYKLLPDSTGADSSDFVLRGVIRKGHEAHVLIGNVILKEGERRGDLKILDIQNDRVICKKGRKIVTLLLRKNE